MVVDLPVRTSYKSSLNIVIEVIDLTNDTFYVKRVIIEYWSWPYMFAYGFIFNIGVL